MGVSLYHAAGPRPIGAVIYIMKGGKMPRFSSSYLVTIVLCSIIVTLLYFYWSVSGQLKTEKDDKISMRSGLQAMDAEKEKLIVRLKTLANDLQSQEKDNIIFQTENKELKGQLEEAQNKLVSLYYI